MKKRCLFAILCSILLVGCGKEIAQEQDVVEVAKESEIEGAHTTKDVANSESIHEFMDDEEKVSEEISSTEIISENTTEVFNSIEKTVEDMDEEELEKPYILDFVDVFQKHYETEILPSIKKHTYNNDFFVHNGDYLAYEGDDRYDYRLGIDVSHHQGAIDFSKVKQAGYEFAILRIGYRGYGKEGKVCPDKQFETYYRNARDQGMDIGCYFFAQAINEQEAKEEAEFVIERLKGKNIQLPVVYDPESILDATARTDNVTAEQFTANTRVFCETVKTAGYEPMIYSNMLWEAFQLHLDELAEFEIWYADYELQPQTPYHFTMWQYTNAGSVPGITGRTDLDIQLIEK